MHANTSNMNKYDYNHDQNQILDTKSKAIQQVQIEDTASVMKVIQLVMKVIH